MDVVARTLANLDTPAGALSSSRISVRIAASGQVTDRASERPSEGANANEASGTRRARISESPTITEAIASLPPRRHVESMPAPHPRSMPAMIAAAFVAAVVVFVALRVTERAQLPTTQMQNTPIVTAIGEVTPTPTPTVTAKRAFRLEIESTPT